MRDNEWLEERMYTIWESYFNDIPRHNLVVIKFGKRSKRLLGSIQWATNRTRGVSKIVARMQKAYGPGFHEQFEDKRISLITITKLYQDPAVPDFIVDSTIAHEMIHYAHGFSSPLKQVYAHPHKGGVIRKEMVARGMEMVWRKAKKWLKEHWGDYVGEML